MPATSFDRWNPPPELINFALDELPSLYAVPGQHDLAHHSYEDIRKSGYWTLVKAGRVVNLPALSPVEVPGITPLRLWGFPWGTQVMPLTDPCDLVLDVAVVHAYFWTKGRGYPGASEEGLPSRWKKRVRGYDVAVFGDNHTPCHIPRGNLGIEMYGCGGFFRRKSDERDHQPSVGLLRSDGSVTRHYLNVEADRFVDDVREAATAPGLEGLLEELGRLADRGIDFAVAVRRALDNEGVSETVRAVVLKALEGKE